MKTKEEIVANWLPRYTKRNLEDFGEYILLTNFNKYVEIFANQFNVPILGRDANMISASAEGITMINLVWEVLTLPSSWTCWELFNPRLVCFWENVVASTRKISLAI